MDELKTGVYAIRCLKNNRVYVGSAARSFRHRWTRHRNELDAGTHHNKALQNSWRKYGADEFTFEILLICEPEECVEQEQRFLDELKATDKRFGFNACPIAGSSRGFKHSEETRRKLSESRKGRPISPEARAKSAATQRGRKRPPCSAEWRERLSKAGKGLRRSKETRARMSAAMKGRIRTPEHCAAISAAKSGKKIGPLSDEHRSKLSEAKRGKPRPPHVIEAMNEGRRKARAKRLAEQPTSGS